MQAINSVAEDSVSEVPVQSDRLRLEHTLPHGLSYGQIRLISQPAHGR
jgi:hypothetical protein